ncbi:lipoprotein [Vibrio harveyi]|nr:lipoprotein [Vibrio harveyi]
MKKILTLLGSITVLASASVTVACQPTMTVTLDQV